MLAAEHERRLAVREYLRRALLDRGEGVARFPEGKLEIARIENLRVRQIEVLIGAVRFQSIRLRAHDAARKPRAGPVGRRRIKGRAENHDPRVFIRRVAAEKRFLVLLHLCLPFAYLGTE